MVTKKDIDNFKKEMNKLESSIKDMDSQVPYDIYQNYFYYLLTRQSKQLGRLTIALLILTGILILLTGALICRSFYI
jgi:hypothetical protein